MDAPGMGTPTLTAPPQPAHPDTPRRGPIGRIVAASLVAGAAAALVLDLVVVPGAAEHVVTGATLLGFALGWVLLAVLSQRWTDRPQRWALVPAVVMGVAGTALLLLAPGERGMAALGWAWPPVLLGLAVWMLVQARRHLAGRTRALLVYPVIVLTALAAAAGAVESVRDAAAPGAPAAGRMVDVGGHRLYLECTGTGAPTVVLSSGFGEHSPSWAWIAPAVAQDTRVCAYDRAGVGWSEPAAHPQDGVEVAGDLHALLAAAGEAGPYVLAGHSTGGVYDLVFADRYPEDVAGVVLLDSSTPDQFALPGYAASYDMWRRASGLLPSLARLGLGRLSFETVGAGLPPDARDQERALASSARDLRGQRDEWSQLPEVFPQARRLTDLGGKPLLVVTAGRGHDAAWFAAQDRLAALSDDSAHRVLENATHGDLLLDRDAAARSAQGVRDVVQAVRSGSPVRP
jgi:pimeloyl-ACP methyl ester carboxylesterase